MSERQVPVVAVAMANNPEVIGCIGAASEAGIARFLLLGPPDEIRRLADEQGVSLADAEIVNENDGPTACARAAAMASSGEVQVLMKGLVQTADFVRAILAREHGLVGEGCLLSHLAAAEVAGFGRRIFLSDAAITTFPDAKQKQQIVLNAVAAVRAVGVQRPRVAMVAPVEKVSEKIQSTVDAAAVVEALKDDPRMYIDGPFGLDVAIRPMAAQIKGIGGEVAGRADILITPSIDVGNVLYKALTGFVGIPVAGIVVGARVPAILTSRADTEAGKLASVRFALEVAAGMESA
jgi:phosphate butyryltransferase